MKSQNRQCIGNKGTEVCPASNQIKALPQRISFCPIQYAGKSPPGDHAFQGAAWLIPDTCNKQVINTKANFYLINKSIF